MHQGLIEIVKAAHLLNPALEAQGAVTFRATARPLVDWEKWTQQVWIPILGPAFQQALGLARNGRIRELAVLDWELSGKLPATLVEGSWNAGRRVLAVSRTLRGEKGVEKFFPLIEAGKAAGHLVSIHALRTAAFHVSDPVAAGAYAYQEAVGGLFPTHPTLVGECVETAMKLNFSDSQPSAFLRVA